MAAEYPPASGPPPNPSAETPPRPRRGQSCLITVLALVVLLVVVCLGTAVFVLWLGGRAKDAMVPVGPCPYVTDAEAGAAVGTAAEARLYPWGADGLLDPADEGVLRGKDTCILVPTGTPPNQTTTAFGQTVKYQGIAAASDYDNQLGRSKSLPSTLGKAYLNREITGLGDKAFCTNTLGTLAGVVVVERETLLYVAVSTAGTEADDEKACATSQVLARQILAKG